MPRTKFTLRPSLAFSYIGSVTARHSSSGVSQTLRRGITNGITELSQRRHVYSAGRPSRWASAHILVHFYFISTIGAMLCCPVAPVLVRTSPRVVAIPAGSAAQLFCQGQGRPRPEVTWLKDGVELVPGLYDSYCIHTVDYSLYSMLVI